MNGASRPRRTLPISVLRNRDFRLLWGGQFVSTLGTQMHAVALSWQVYEITGSTVQLGLVGLVRAVALMTTSLIGGAVADTRDRRKLMLITQTILLSLSAALAAISRSGTVSVGLLYAFAALVAATSAFDGPARQALIPSIVSREQFAPAMSLNILAMSTARMIGPALGGVAVAVVGVAGTYVIDAFSFLGVIGALLVMQTRLSAPQARVSGPAAIAEGLRFMAQTPVIWGVMLLDFLATLLGSTVGLAPVFARDVLDAGPQGLGLLLAAPAAGSVLGGLAVSVVPQISRPGRVVVGSIVVYGACLAVFGAARSLPAALLALCCAGAADSVSVAMRHTVRNLATPDELRGRVAASHSALAMGGPRLGEFQSGVTAALIGPRAAMVLGGAGCVLAALVVSRMVPAISRYRIDDDASGEVAQRLTLEARPPRVSASARRGPPAQGR
jgi:MFS family permease